ncbi:MAG: ribulose-phosphate 3-epimerase [Chloroflexota bacterium]|nr:ribulose-phosphate 3-epimerase [Chloroflexota bacterium]
MIDPTQVEICPSILSADFTRLGDQVREIEAAGARRLQIDVMDGTFVPNISMGAGIVAAVRSITPLLIETHLMIVRPELHIPDFAKAGADLIIVHQEATLHLHRTVEQIKGLGKQAGVALNPATSLTTLEEILEYVDQVLIMTVNPGFGGQAFIPSMLPKLRRLRAMLDERGLDPLIEVDGGISPQTAPLVVAAGARVLVAGSAVYTPKQSVAAAMAALRASYDGTAIA